MAAQGRAGVMQVREIAVEDKPGSAGAVRGDWRRTQLCVEPDCAGMRARLAEAPLPEGRKTRPPRARMIPA